MHRNQRFTLLEMTESRDRPMRRRAGARASRGFTLIELLVAFTVLGVLMSVAVPSFISFQRNSELTAAANSLAASLAAARAEAMKRQLNVLVRPAGGNDWRQGWTAYADTNWNFRYDVGTDVQLLEESALPASVSVAVDGTASDSTSHYVMFSGSGFMRDDMTGAFSPSHSVRLSSSSGESRLVIIGAAGRLRVCNPASESNCSSTDSM